MLRCVCLAGIAVFAVGCSSTLREYRCTSAEECVGASEGRCESSGHCSFADEFCPDGFRFGEASGAESGACVGEDTDMADASLAVPDGAPAADGPQQSLWLQRHRLSINNVGFEEELDNFPVLVALTPGRVDYSRMQPNGQDLRFTGPGGVVALAHEIETWNPTGTSYIWVQVQKIDADTESDSILMYYDNALASDAQDTEGVWSNGYEAVYHFSDPGAVFRNSVSQSNHGLNSGTTAVAGAVGGARHFDGTSAHVKLNNQNPMDMLQGVSGITVTAYIKPQTLGLQYGLVNVAIGNSACSDKSRVALYIPNGPADEVGMAARSSDSDPLTTRVTSNVNLVNDSWYLVSAAIDVDFLNNEVAATPYGRVRFVANETLNTSSTLRFAAPATALTQPTCGAIGAQDDGNSDHFNGAIDEVRISGVDRTTTWLQAQYKSMQDDDYVRFGDAEDVSEAFGE